MQGHYFRTTPRPHGLLIEIPQPVGSLAEANVLEELELVRADCRGVDAPQVIVDFCQTSYFGSSLLEALRIIWQEIEPRGGRMVLCNLSPLGTEIVTLMKFDQLWPVLKTRTLAEERLQTPHS